MDDGVADEFNAVLFVELAVVEDLAQGDVDVGGAGWLLLEELVVGEEAVLVGAEEEDVLLAQILFDLEVGAIATADDETAIHDELHV